MVVLHVKSVPAAAAAASSPARDEDEATEFLYECAASAAVADVAAALGALAGLQAGLLSLCRRIRERSAGAAGACAAAAELERALDEAEAYASKEQVQRNRFLSSRALREHIKNIEKKCAAALQEPPEALSLQESTSDNKHERIQIWWAGKELAMEQKLSDYIGVNDKTKAPGRVVGAVITLLKDKLPASTYKVLADYHSTHSETLALQAAATDDEEDCTSDRMRETKEDLEERLMPELKSLVLGTNKE